MKFIIQIILWEKSLATLDCFQIYLVNAESMEFCFVCLETGFISEQLCMKTFVVVADTEEKQGQIYGKGTLSKIALWRYVTGPRNAKS